MKDKKIPTKMYLEESELPRYWYNINAILKDKHAPALNPKTLKPCTLEELEEVVATLDGTKFRAKQIYNRIYNNTCKSIDDMTDLPLNFRENLKEKYVMSDVVLKDKTTS